MHRVARIEPFISELVGSVGSFGELEEAFVEKIEGATADPAMVAFKSVIAYSTGFDVGDPTPEERERADDFRETRENAKPVREALGRVLGTALECRWLDGRDGDLVHGPGVADMKGGIAVAAVEAGPLAHLASSDVATSTLDQRLRLPRQ